MILVTTTPSVDGYTITNYQGIVFDNARFVAHFG